MYIFFDTETTGTSRYNDHIVQLAWILTDSSGRILDQACDIVKPDGYTIPISASNIHGITTSQAAKNGKPLKAVLGKLSSVAEHAIALVAHNISFDISILESNYKRISLRYPLSGKKHICTMRSSTEWCKLPKLNGKAGYKWPTLEELHYKLFGESFGEAHDALVDTKACLRCYFKLVNIGVIDAPDYAKRGKEGKHQDRHEAHQSAARWKSEQEQKQTRHRREKIEAEQEAEEARQKLDAIFEAKKEEVYNKYNKLLDAQLPKDSWDNFFSINFISSLGYAIALAAMGVKGSDGKLFVIACFLSLITYPFIKSILVRKHKEKPTYRELLKQRDDELNELIKRYFYTEKIHSQETQPTTQNSNTTIQSGKYCYQHRIYYKSEYCPQCGPRTIYRNYSSPQVNQGGSQQNPDIKRLGKYCIQHGVYSGSDHCPRCSQREGKHSESSKIVFCPHCGKKNIAFIKDTYHKCSNCGKDIFALKGIGSLTHNFKFTTNTIKSAKKESISTIHRSGAVNISISNRDGGQEKTNMLPYIDYSSDGSRIQIVHKYLVENDVYGEMVFLPESTLLSPTEWGLCINTDDYDKAKRLNYTPELAEETEGFLMCIYIEAPDEIEIPPNIFCSLWEGTAFVVSYYGMLPSANHDCENSCQIFFDRNCNSTYSVLSLPKSWQKQLIGYSADAKWLNRQLIDDLLPRNKTDLETMLSNQEDFYSIYSDVEYIFNNERMDWSEDLWPILKAYSANPSMLSNKKAIYYNLNEEHQYNPQDIIAFFSSVPDSCLLFGSISLQNDSSGIIPLLPHIRGSISISIGATTLINNAAYIFGRNIRCYIRDLAIFKISSDLEERVIDVVSKHCSNLNELYLPAVSSRLIKALEKNLLSTELYAGDYYSRLLDKAKDKYLSTEKLIQINSIFN
jgi:DNA polymerase III epsilon subunit-like protein